jgi:RNA polymerase sigma factor (sigma-70 family)
MAIADPVDVASLVRLCQQGHSEAFAPLVRRFQNAGYAVALSHVRDPDDAQDVLQDAFVTAFCRVGQLRDPAAFGAWFRSIVVSQSRLWLRHRRVAQQGAVVLAAGARSTVDGSPGQQTALLAGRELWERVWDLPEQYRCPALLHYLSGFSEEETADFLQVPLSTVHGRLQQARKRLRRTLTRAEMEEIAMSTVDITAEMEEILYQLANEPVHEVVDLAGCPNVVLFCGATVDVEVEQADGDELVLEGSRVSMGLSPEAARQSARQLRILWDRVDDFASAGPHGGELFGGTNVEKGGKPVTYAISTGSVWAAYVEGLGWGANGIRPEEGFPELTGRFCPFPEELKGALKRCCRMTVVQEKAQALILPTSAYQPRLSKVFRPNWSRPESLHGPVGYVSLLVRLPPGRCLTIISADSVSVREVHGTVFVVNSGHTEVAGVTGDVFLLNSPADSVTGIRGRLHQRFYSFGAMNWQPDGTLVARRAREHTSVVQDVEGSVDLDVGKVDLELRGIRGSASVVNRYGRTRLWQQDPLDGTRLRLESVSGPVHLFLHGDVLTQARLAVVTLCGAIGQHALADVDKDTSNSRQVAALATKPDRPGGRWYRPTEAEVLVRTECGEVSIEQIPS